MTYDELEVGMKLICNQTDGNKKELIVVKNICLIMFLLYLSLQVFMSLGIICLIRKVRLPFVRVKL